MCGAAGADVEETGRAGLREMERHVDRILDVDEIALLLAVTILRAIALEEPHAAGFANLLVGLLHDAAHIALVILVRPEHVEVFEPARSTVESRARRVEIEEVLRVRIRIERAKSVKIGLIREVGLERSVGRCRRRINESRLGRDGPMRERFVYS